LITTPTKDKPPHRLPPNINKELEKRKIGNRFVIYYDFYILYLLIMGRKAQAQWIS
jgi:hypothetical protein